MERYRLFDHDIDKIEELLDGCILAREGIEKKITTNKEEKGE